MPWHRTGTVAITAGQNTVTGTGTAFSANARVGDAFLGPDGRWYEVTNIASGTALSILPAYQGATVTGGTYSITPVQGYDKLLRDAFNGVNQQWGSTLAGLGTVSTENVVPVAKGGTGGTTAALARSGLGLKAAAVADIVGTVSQSGGVPTGAITERGSNANGEYVKFADGTMICTSSTAQTDTVASSFGGGFIGAEQTWTFPAPFVATPAFAPFVRGSASLTWPIYNGTNTTTGRYYNAAIVSQAAKVYSGTHIAIGRWF
jgi:hypothetical protein